MNKLRHLRKRNQYQAVAIALRSQVNSKSAHCVTLYNIATKSAKDNIDWMVHKRQCKSESSAKLGGAANESKAITDLEDNQKCSFCSRITKDLKKCTRCCEAQYCNKSCQQRDWDHKKLCKSVPSQDL